MPILRVPTFRRNRLLVECDDGVTRWIEYTDQHAKQSVATGNAQLKAGLRVPVSWMHDAQAKPQYLSHDRWKPVPSNPHAWIAQGWIGEVLGWEWDPKAREAVSYVEIPDPKEAEQFKKIGTVSPGVDFDWRDELGRQWNGPTITHIASTPKPKQRNISRVTEVAAYPGTCLSHPPGMAVCLSFKVNIRSVKAMAKPEEMNAEEGMDGGCTPDQLKNLVKAFKNAGIHIHGEPKTIDELVLAANSGIATKNGGVMDHVDDEPTADGDADAGDPEHAPATPPALYMSWSPEQLSFCKEKAEAMRAGYVARANACAEAGQIDVASRDALIGDVTKVNLSHEPARFFTRKFKFREPEVAIALAFAERLPKGKFSKQNIEAANGRAHNQGTSLSHAPAKTHLPAAAPGLADADPEARVNQLLSRLETRHAK